MVARIFRPAKTAMQSGKSNSQDWILAYDPQSARKVEPLMGYTSSSDMLSQIKLKFDTKELAIDYAERNGIEFQVSEPHEQSRRRVSYSDNFSHTRKISWTH
jgi:hypothetical protein